MIIKLFYAIFKMIMHVHCTGAYNLHRSVYKVILVMAAIADLYDMQLITLVHNTNK